MPENWKETCAKCKDGEIEPIHCEYYGEPNGCNSPTYGEHPDSAGDASALLDALKQVRELAQSCINACSDEIDSLCAKIVAVCNTAIEKHAVSDES